MWGARRNIYRCNSSAHECVSQQPEGVLNQELTGQVHRVLGGAVGVVPFQQG